MNDEELAAAMAANQARESAKVADAPEDPNVMKRVAQTHNDFVYDKVENKYRDLSDLKLISDRAVNGLIPFTEWYPKLDETGDVVTDKNGNPKRVQPSVSLTDAQFGRIIDGTVWLPNSTGEHIVRDKATTDEGFFFDTPGKHLLNLYFKPKHDAEPIPGSWEAYQNHAKMLYGDHAERFLDYAAHMLQCTAEKPGYGIVLSGDQGIGKDLLLKPLMECVGPGNATSVDPALVLDISGNNSYLKTVMLVFEETTSDSKDKKPWYEKTKTIFAAGQRNNRIKEKYQKPIIAVNCVRPFITTNHPGQLWVEEGDRRYFIPDVRITQREYNVKYGTKHSAKIAKLIEPGAVAEIYMALMNRDLSSFKTYPEPSELMTETKEILLSTIAHVRDNSSARNGSVFLEDYLDTLEDIEPEGIMSADLIRFYEDNKEKYGKNPVLSGSFPHLLRDNYGYVSVPGSGANKRWQKKVKGKNRNTKHVFVKDSVQNKKEFAEKLFLAWATESEIF